MYGVLKPASTVKMEVPAADDEGGVDDEDVTELLVAIIDAVAMDSRERTRSSGYVVPAQKQNC